MRVAYRVGGLEPTRAKCSYPSHVSSQTKLSDGGEMVLMKGNLIDVPANSWIDIRLDRAARTGSE